MRTGLWLACAKRRTELGPKDRPGTVQVDSSCDADTGLDNAKAMHCSSRAATDLRPCLSRAAEYERDVVHLARMNNTQSSAFCFQLKIDAYSKQVDLRAVVWSERCPRATEPTNRRRVTSTQVTLS